jgi:hypothetical protein
LLLYEPLLSSLGDFKGRELQVLLSIAYLGAEGINCPSFSVIARNCRISERTVGHCVEALVESGCLKISQRRTKRGRRLSSHYVVSRSLIGIGEE